MCVYAFSSCMHILCSVDNDDKVLLVPLQSNSPKQQTPVETYRLSSYYWSILLSMIVCFSAGKAETECLRSVTFLLDYFLRATSFGRRILLIVPSIASLPSEGGTTFNGVNYFHRCCCMTNHYNCPCGMCLFQSRHLPERAFSRRAKENLDSALPSAGS